MPRHLWYDALHADAIRSRLLELRYPLRDVGDTFPEGIVRLVERIRRADNDTEFVAGFYLGLRRALVGACDEYLQHVDPLDDAPSVRVIRIMRSEEAEMLAEVDQAWRKLEAMGDAAQVDAWRAYVREQIASVGGLLGNHPEKPPATTSFDARPAFRRVDESRRDPRFASTLYHEGGTRPPRSPAEMMMERAVSHLNEIWAAEVPASCMWDRQDLPWEFYVDAARWLYDEMRHCMMGEQRLLSWGVPYEEMPLGTIQYDMMVQEPVLYRLALLHHRETGGIGHKEGMRDAAAGYGETATAQDFDYDWADERIHVHYGVRWLKHLAGDSAGPDVLQQLRQEGNARMVAHVSAVRQSGHPRAHRRPQDRLLEKAEALLGPKLAQRA